MRQARKILTVASNGQISIGKKWAGREVVVETLSDNQIVITAGTFIPADQQTFFSSESQAKLAEYNDWATKNPPKKTDVAALRKRLAAKKEK